MIEGKGGDAVSTGARMCRDTGWGCERWNRTREVKVGGRNGGDGGGEQKGEGRKVC